jgi:hypothetical protein
MKSMKGTKGHEEEQKALTTDWADQSGSERIATARETINEGTRPSEMELACGRSDPL